MTYKCKKCKITQSLSEFYKTTDRKCGHKTICKTCIKANPLTKAIAYLDKHAKNGKLV